MLPVTLANPVIKAPVVANTATLLVAPILILALPLGVWMSILVVPF